MFTASLLLAVLGCFYPIFEERQIWKSRVEKEVFPRGGCGGHFDRAQPKLSSISLPKGVGRNNNARPLTERTNRRAAGSYGHKGFTFFDVFLIYLFFR